MQTLINAIPSATDQKGILDLQARIQAEQGMLQTDQTKLHVLYQADAGTGGARGGGGGLAGVGGGGLWGGGGGRSRG